MSLAITLSQVRAPSRPLAAAGTSERAVVGFMTVQMFSLIYLQKLALFAHTTPLCVPMLILFASVAWMVMFDHLKFVPQSVAAYLLFVGFCLLSYSYLPGSFLSLMMMIMLYFSMTLFGRVSDANYYKILNRFTKMMILPACIVIESYIFQKLTGKSDWLSMDKLLPSAILSQGFNYSGHVPWNGPFVRPQGFFFLEPSLTSAFLASAAIIEITYFRRWWLVISVLVAVVMSTGATGIVMLVLAAPFLLAREKPPVIFGTISLVTIALVTLLSLGVALPVLSRTDELQTKSSSSGERLTMPFMRLMELASTDEYLFIGSGAGTVTPVDNHKRLLGGVKALKKAYSSGKAVMNPWPVVKLFNEEGLLATIAFFALYIIGITGNFNVPLKISLSIMYMFTGGYLLSPIMVELVIVLCFLVGPTTVTKAPRYAA